MNSAMSFAKIIARATEEDIDQVITSDEFPAIAAWLEEHRQEPYVAAALDRLIAAVRRTAH